MGEEGAGVGFSALCFTLILSRYGDLAAFRFFQFFSAMHSGNAIFGFFWSVLLFGRANLIGNQLTLNFQRNNLGSLLSGEIPLYSIA